MHKDKVWIYTECEQLQRATSLDEIFRHLERFGDSLGIDQLLYTALPSFYLQSGACLPPVIHSTYDPGWLEYYLDKRFDRFDKALLHCLSGAETAFLWPESFFKGELADAQRQVMQEASAAGLNYGLTLPMHNMPGALGVISFSYRGSAQEFNKLYRLQQNNLAMFSLCLNEAVLCSHASTFGRPHKPNLTVREIEVIKWLANGCSYHHIADKLSISQTTVKKHVGKALAKMHARNSTHACVQALRWGYI